MRAKLASLLLLTGLAWGQGVRFGNAPIINTLPSVQTLNGIFTGLQPASSVAIQFCTAPANGAPCTNKATTYTSSTLVTPCATSTQVVLDGTTSCVANTDTKGNWGVWARPGQYEWTYTDSGGNSHGPYPVTIAGAGGTMVNLVGDCGASATATATVNTAAIKACIANNPNATFTVPEATILPVEHDGANAWAVSLPTGTTIQCSGVGSGFKLADGQTEFVRLLSTVQASSNVNVYGCELDGNGAAQLDLANRQNHCIFVQQSSKVKFQYNYIHDCNGDLIELWGGSGAGTSSFDISFNQFTNGFQSAIGFISAENGIVHDNIINADHAFESIHGEVNDVTNQINRNIEVASNIIIGSTSAGCIAAGGCGGISFTGDPLVNPNFGYINIHDNYLLNSSHILVQRNPHVKVVNNTILDSYDLASAVQIFTWDALVEANTVEWQSVTAATATYGAMVVQCASHCPAAGMGRNRIRNNTIRAAFGVGIYIYDSSDNDISGNTIDQVLLNTGVARGIYLFSSAAGRTKNNSLDGNHVMDSQGVPTLIHCFEGGFTGANTGTKLGLTNTCSNNTGTAVAGIISTNGGFGMLPNGVPFEAIDSSGNSQDIFSLDTNSFLNLTSPGALMLLKANTVEVARISGTADALYTDGGTATLGTVSKLWPKVYATDFVGGIGATTPAAGAFTSLTTGGAITPNGSVSQGTALKFASVTTGSIGSSSSAAVTLTFSGVFTAAAWMPVCSVLEATASTSTLRIHHIESITNTTNATAVVRVVNDDGVGAHTGTLYCYGISGP